MPDAIRRSLPRGWLLAALVAWLAVLASLVTHVAASVAEHGDEVAEAATDGRPSGALVVAAVVATLLVGAAVLRRGRIGALMLVAAPVTVYVVGELSERLLGGAVHPEAGPLVTLATQVPAALVAYLVARLLIRTVRHMARLLARRLAPVVVRAPATPVLLASDERPRPRIPAGTHRGRGPPLPAST